MPLPIVASNASTVTKAVDVFDVVVLIDNPVIKGFRTITTLIFLRSHEIDFEVQVLFAFHATSDSSDWQVLTPDDWKPLIVGAVYLCSKHGFVIGCIQEVLRKDLRSPIP